MFKHFSRYIAAAGIAASFAFAPAVFAQSAVLDAPAAPLEERAPMDAVAGSDTEYSSTEARAYAVDYVIAFRNVLGLAVIILVFAHVQGNAKSGCKKSAQQKSYVGLIVIAMVGLLAMQGLSFWLYARESGTPGGVMHKSVPLGREYFLY